MGDTFATGLASRSAQPLVQPLTHGVMRDAPAGRLRGIARPSVGAAPPPLHELPLAGEEIPGQRLSGPFGAERGSATEIAAQRTTQPARAPLTSAPTPDTPGRRVRPVPPVQRRTAEPSVTAATPADVVTAGAPPAVGPSEASGDGDVGVDLPLAPPAGAGAADATAQPPAPMQRSVDGSDTGSSTVPPATPPLVDTAGTQPVEADAPTLATGQPLQHQLPVAEGPAGAATPSAVPPTGAPGGEAEPLPVARSTDAAPPSSHSTPDGSPRPGGGPPRAADATVQRAAAAGDRPARRRVGLGEPLVAPVQRSVARHADAARPSQSQPPTPSMPPGDAAPSNAAGSSGAGPSGDGPTVDAPLIGGRASATSLPGPESVPPAGGGAAAMGAPADLPLQRSQAETSRTAEAPAVPGAPAVGGSPDPGGAPAVRDAPPPSGDDAWQQGIVSPPEGAVPSSEGAASSGQEPASAAPLIGDRPPATALGGPEPVSSPGSPASAVAAVTADPVASGGAAVDLPLQRRPGDAPSATTAGPSTTAPATDGPALPLVAQGAGGTVAQGEGQWAGGAESGSGRTSPIPDVATPVAADSAPATPDADTALPPDGSSPVASAPLLPHRPALIQRTLDLHAEHGAPPAAGAGHVAQPATRPAPTSATASGPRGTAPRTDGAAVTGVAGSSRAARPAQAVQPLRRAVDGASGPAPSGPSPASVAPLDAVRPSHGPGMTAGEVEPAAVPAPGGGRGDPSGFGAMPLSTDPPGGADVVSLRALGPTGGTGGSTAVAPAVQTLTSGTPALPAPARVRGAGRQMSAPGPAAVQRMAALPGGVTAGPAVPAPAWSAADGTGEDPGLPLPPGFTSLSSTGSPPAGPTLATAGPPLAGPALTTAVQREIATSVPVPDPAVTPSPPVQRQESPEPAPSAEPVPPTATVAPEPAPTPPGGEGPKTEEELDVLAGRLYDHIAGRLRHELRMDRERTGLLNDLH